MDLWAGVSRTIVVRSPHRSPARSDADVLASGDVASPSHHPVYDEGERGAGAAGGSEAGSLRLRLDAKGALSAKSRTRARERMWILKQRRKEVEAKMRLILVDLTG